MGRIRRIRLIIAAIIVLAPAAPAAARQGARLVSGPVERETSAQMMRQGASLHAAQRVLPARRGEPAKRSGGGTGTTQPARFAGRATGPRTAFGSVFNFLGPTLADTAGVFPPDTEGAVGPSQFLVTINGRFRSYDKATGLADGALDVDPDAFFAGQLSTPPAGGVVFSSDPHVRYDRLSQRWFIVMIDAPLDASFNTSTANRILIAHSDGPVLTSSTVWTKTFIQVSGVFADYPTLGVDANALYVGTNNFSTSSPFGFASTSGYVIKKSSVLGAGPVTATRFTLASGSGAGPFTPQGADNPDPGATQGYFAGVDNAVFSQLDLVRISDPGGTPTASGNLTVAVPTTRFPINVPNLGGTTPLDALDDRLFAASIRNGRLWTAHNIQVNSSGAGSTTGGRDGSRWYELDLGATPALVQSGTVFDSSASNPLSYWIPTVAVSGQGHMAIGGSVAGAAHHADAWFSGRLATDAPGALDAPTLYTASSAAYNPAGDTGDPRRWGDFSAVALDPLDDMTMWTIQEYVSSANVWGTRIARLDAPGPATPVTAFPRVVPGRAAMTVTLTGSTAGGRGFYDPGPGFTRPQVTAGCGIAVTSVAVDSPGQATLVLDTTAATGPGPCSVTFTNPDGQVASAAVLTFDNPPVAGDDGYTVAQGGTLLGSSVLGNDTDPDGDPLTAAKATDPGHGAVTLNPDGTFTYTPAAGYSGPDAFTYTASDGALTDTATVSITVTPAANRAPVAVDDAYSVAQNSVLNGTSVLANDSDPDGNALTAAKASDPSHGTLSVRPDGTFTYTPAAGYAGPDAFTYTASDGALTATGRVGIVVRRTKLTLRLAKLSRRHGRLRLKASGAGPTGAVVRVVLRRGAKRVAVRRRTVRAGRWSVVFSVRRHGRYTVTASAGTQRVVRRKRI